MKDGWLMALDAGGSFIKYAAVEASGEVAGDVRQLPVDSYADSEAVLASYACAISALMAEAEKRKRPPLGVGIATPGPFDFRAGRSLMTHKFASIYNMDLRGEITRRAGLPERTKIAFIQDANAFLLGEYWVGAARNFASAAAVTLGTGLGYACIREGNLLVNEMGSPYLSLYRERWGGGIVEDAASARGVVNAYAARKTDAAAAAADARSVGDLALAGDRDAAAAFEQLGRALGSVLAEPISRLGIQCLVLGGQVSHSYKLFKESLTNELAGVRSLQKICVGEHLDSSTLFGAACAVLEELPASGNREEKICLRCKTTT